MDCISINSLTKSTKNELSRLTQVYTINLLEHKSFNKPGDCLKAYTGVHLDASVSLRILRFSVHHSIFPVTEVASSQVPPFSISALNVHKELLNSEKLCSSDVLRRIVLDECAASLFPMTTVATIPVPKEEFSLVVCALVTLEFGRKIILPHFSSFLSISDPTDLSTDSSGPRFPS